MSKRFFLIVGVVAGLSIASSHAQATLIGDTVELNRIVNGAVASGPFMETVVAGPVEFLPSNIGPGHPFTVNIEASSIVIEATDTSFGITNEHRLEISSLDWFGNPSGFITGVSVSASNITETPGGAPFDISRVTFSDHAVNIDLVQTQWGMPFSTVPGTLTINLQTSHSYIPEPLTATLGLLTISAIGAVTRRRTA